MLIWTENFTDTNISSDNIKITEILWKKLTKSEEAIFKVFFYMTFNVILFIIDISMIYLFALIKVLYYIQIQKIYFIIKKQF